jgi:hypothetical protein
MSTSGEGYPDGRGDAPGFLRYRRLTPEILDTLPPSDPAAIRSRCDLQKIDRFLGNTRWLVSQICSLSPPPADIAELGAGSGRFLEALHTALPSATLTGYDLHPAPCGTMRWVEGNILQTLQPHEVIVGSLIAHHFDESSLRSLGKHLASARAILFVEPLRTALSYLMALCALPFSGRVTRHDMPASIRAGFRPGELAPLLGLTNHTITEKAVQRGVLRFIAVRSGFSPDELTTPTPRQK